MNRRVLAGLTLLVAGAGIALWPLRVYLATWTRGATLTARAEHMATAPSVDTPSGTAGAGGTGAPAAGPVAMTVTLPLARPEAGRLMGGLAIPALGVTAPLLEGTEDRELNAGAGHLTGSALPGAPGTCVIAAHNATWFRRLDRLKPGDELTVWTEAGRWVYRVDGSRVVRTGDAVANSVLPTLILETCYPLDALYRTPERLLVSASLVRAERTTGGSAQAGGGPPAASIRTGAPNVPPLAIDVADPYRAFVPADLAGPSGSDLTLSANGLPMGRLEMDGPAAPSFTAGNRPLAAVNTLVQLTMAYVHASTSGNRADLAQLLTHADADSPRVDGNPLFGKSIRDVRYAGAYNVTLKVDGVRLTEACGTLAMIIQGHPWTLSVKAAADASGWMSLRQVRWRP
ncbi:class D sortase [Alicyclobacillus sp.]|uniref:class D sortase n=1 Tax=Alicyclobacillus sp. TaxID=61169 RepID=UPI0025BCC71D|nr:class D sortase [Alicyclobacillus sp.]MCL6517557.1 class D sortase [Alicyclobacillus sp.]